MEQRPLVFRVHALRRMFERSISDADVREVIEQGEVLREYPEDLPFPSRLMLGFVGTRPIHVVAADDPDERTVVIITVYEPDPRVWDDGYRRRRP